MNQQAQQNVWLWRQVLRADLLNALWWVLCTLEKQIKALLNTQNSARGTNVLPQQPTTSLAPAVLCGMCSFICMHLDYHTCSVSLLDFLAVWRKSSRYLFSWRGLKAQCL